MNKEMMTLPVSLENRNRVNTVKEMRVNEFKDFVCTIVSESFKQHLGVYINEILHEKFELEISRWNNCVKDFNNKIDQYYITQEENQQLFNETVNSLENTLYNNVMDRVVTQTNKHFDAWYNKEMETRNHYADLLRQKLKESIKTFRNELLNNLKQWYGEYIDIMEKRQTDLEKRLENLEQFKKYVETHK